MHRSIQPHTMRRGRQRRPICLEHPVSGMEYLQCLDPGRDQGRSLAGSMLGSIHKCRRIVVDAEVGVKQRAERGGRR
jgi:hypothetical protein